MTKPIFTPEDFVYRAQEYLQGEARWQLAKLSADVAEEKIQPLLEENRIMREALEIVVHGKGAGPYSAMHRIREARKALADCDAIRKQTNKKGDLKNEEGV